MICYYYKILRVIRALISSVQALKQISTLLILHKKYSCNFFLFSITDRALDSAVLLFSEIY